MDDLDESTITEIWMVFRGVKRIICRKDVVELQHSLGELRGKPKAVVWTSEWFKPEVGAADQPLHLREWKRWEVERKVDLYISLPFGRGSSWDRFKIAWASPPTKLRHAWSITLFEQPFPTPYPSLREWSDLLRSVSDTPRPQPTTLRISLHHLSIQQLHDFASNKYPHLIHLHLQSANRGTDYPQLSELLFDLQWPLFKVYHSLSLPCYLPDKSGMDQRAIPTKTTPRISPLCPDLKSLVFMLHSRLLAKVFGKKMDGVESLLGSLPPLHKMARTLVAIGGLNCKYSLKTQRLANDGDMTKYSSAISCVNLLLQREIEDLRQE